MNTERLLAKENRNDEPIAKDKYKPLFKGLPYIEASLDDELCSELVIENITPSF